MNRMSVSIELAGESPERRAESIAQWLQRHLAVQVMPAQWHILTYLAADEIRQEIEKLLDPADRLLVTQVWGRMSHRNLFHNEQSGAA